MAVYMLLGKFSPEGAKGVQKEGFVARREMAARAATSFGGKLLGYYACGDAEWDVVNLFEGPDDQGHAQMAKTAALLTASGAFSHLRLLPLVTPEAYDAADVRATTQTYKAPGQS